MQDRYFHRLPPPSQDTANNKWFDEIAGELIYIDLNQYSYIVQSHCGIFAHKRTHVEPSFIKNREAIIKAINFTSQFTIQDN